MAKKKFYAVAKGKAPGIYTEWFGKNGAQRQVIGFPGAVYKGFPSRQEAEGFLEHRADDKAKVDVVATDKTHNASEMDKIIIYTDGGCINNPGPGGYGAVILENGNRKELSGGYRLTTNNRMELMACIMALKSLEIPSKALLHSDSKYVVDGISKGWARKWSANGWMRNKKEAAINPDLWEELLELCEKHDVGFKWVKGHAGVPENERCDELATQSALQNELQTDSEYLGSSRQG